MKQTSGNVERFGRLSLIRKAIRLENKISKSTLRELNFAGP